MNVKKMMTFACAAAICGGVWAADNAKPVPTSTANAEKEQVEEEEKDDSPLAGLVAVEAGLAFDSRYMTYGVIDGKDPIVTPSAQITFFDWVYFGVESIFDVTKGNGKRGGYGNRAGEWTTLDSIVGIAHDFEINEDIGALSVDFNYIYESLRRYKYHNSSGADKDMGDTQYLNLELSLGDLWFEPTLWIERDLMADDGTYVNFEIGHTFPIIDGEGEDDDPVLAFRPSVGQGFGNTLRSHGYFNDVMDNGFSHGGLMDTTIKGELTWNFCENFSLTGYVAYSDYWFDGNMRDAARAYNGAWGSCCDHSWNFYGGIALGLSF